MTTYLNTREAGALLKRSRHTIAKWCVDGLIPATKVGRDWLIPTDALAERLAPKHAHTEVVSTSTAARKTS